MAVTTNRDLLVLQHRWPGVCIWQGAVTGSWWAAMPRELVEADSAKALDAVLLARMGGA